MQVIDDESAGNGSTRPPSSADPASSEEAEHSAREATPEPRQPRRIRQVLVGAGVLLVFFAADATLFRRAFTTDPARYAAVSHPLGFGKERVGSPEWIELATEHDRRFVVWLLARNARTWIEHPTRLFDAEACYPAEKALTLGEPILVHGLLGAPIWSLSKEPVAVFNFVLFSLPLLAALAMFLLVRRWTGSFPAALAAGLLYAFHPYRSADLVHFYVYDTTATVFALYFADRWLASGRWRDAAALGAAIACQLAGSLYPLLSAVLLGPPLFAWMVARYGLRRTQWLQWVMIASVSLGTAVVVFSPYLEARDALGLTSSIQIFSRWIFYLPSGREFEGWSAWLLIAAGLILVPKWGLRGTGSSKGDVGLIVVVVGLVFVLLLIATAPGPDPTASYVVVSRGESTAWFNPYLLLSKLIPGLDMVRAPRRISVGMHLLLAVLAGIGAAVILARLSGRMKMAVSCLLVAVVFAEMIEPRALGLSPRIEVVMREHHPADDALAVYQALSDRGVEGPIFEAPIRSPYQVADPLLYAGYHRNRTSACGASFDPHGSEQMKDLATRLPTADAVRVLASMGFRSVAIHHPGGKDEWNYARRVRRAASAQDPPTLRFIATSTDVTAYEILLRAEEKDALE